MAKYLLDIPDETSESAITLALTPLTNSIQWVAVSSDEVYDNEWTFTDDKSWEIISRSVGEIINEIEATDGQEPEDDEPQEARIPAWPPHPYDEWTLEQRRKLIRMAVTRWAHLGPNGVDSELLEQDYRRGLLDKFTKPAVGQAIVTATVETLHTINEKEGIKVEQCHVFDNGIVIYEEEIGIILQRYAEQRKAPLEDMPDEVQLSPSVRIGLMAMAAKSPKWKSQGELDDYRMEQFKEENGDIFDSQT